MAALALLLMLFTVSGYSYVLQPGLTVTQIAGRDRVWLRTEKLRDSSISVEEREKAVKSGEGRKTEEEQRSDGPTPETNPVKQPVKNEMTVEERRREEGLTPERGPENKRKEDKITKNRNIKEIQDRNQGNETISVERLTSETFSDLVIFEEETKLQKYSVADTSDHSDTDKEIEVAMREDSEKTETNEESMTEAKSPLTDNTKKLKLEKTVNSHNTGAQEKGEDDERDGKFKKSGEMEEKKQEILEEERESKLVAGISPPEVFRGNPHEEGEKILTLKEEDVEVEYEEIEGNKRQTPPLSTSAATIQIITLSQNPTSVHHDNVPPLLPVTPTQVSPVFPRSPTVYAKVSPQFFAPSVTLPSHTTNDHILTSTVFPGAVKTVSLFDDLLTEVLQSPGHHLKQNELEVKASPNLDNVMAKNILRKPAQKDPQTTHKADDTRELNTKVQGATPKPKEAKFITKELKPKEPNPTQKSNEKNSTAKPVKLTHKPNTTQPTGKPKTGKLMENDTKFTVKQKKASPSQPQLTKVQLTTAKTPLMRPMKINRGSKKKAIKKSKGKERKKDNKTQKPSKTKEVTTPTHFPYFMDYYCPPDCACYGRVVQCSDKGVDKVPYGIPYNARYILLMNNHIDSIQLDLLNEYVSMEFLVLSNNRLTDGAIEGAFEGVPALKRLYLDRNLLESVPTDLPVSLEELRLDNNQLSVMSEAAWTQCPGLLVLSLSNNSLGNGSESLPNAVLSPLCHLRTLNLDHNQLTSVPLGLPLSIKELYLKGNLIEHFRGGAFYGISELVVLDLSENRLTNKGLVRDSLLNATHVESLNLEGNRLKQVPRHLPLSLKTLNLEGNLISSIKKADFKTLKNLEHLGLARNKISKVVPGAFRTLPVLHQLDLGHNTLRHVPRQLPQSLHSVALSHNKIQSVPRDAFCWGNKSLDLSGLVRVQLEQNLIDMGKLDAQAFRCLRGFQVVHFY
ncbi:hypothetical protein PAMP_015093 [Pampus punctatissimus]